MNKLISQFIFLIFLFMLFSCSKSNSIKDISTKNKKAKDSTNTELSKYDLSSENVTIIKLSRELKEISGIAMTPDGRLFAQQDESGIVYQVDYKTGEIVKKFSLGYIPIKEDFEDIVYANNKFYLLRSNGDLFEFDEGDDGKNVDYKVYKTDLRKSDDAEGLCYDQETNSLLLALKGNSGGDTELDKAIYSFSLNDMKLIDKPRFLLPLSEVKRYFSPSGIQRNPKTGTFFVIAANGNEIIEVSKDGQLLGRHNLPSSVHVQPEGIAFDKDNNLLISNEGKSGQGYIVIYPYLK